MSNIKGLSIQINNSDNIKDIYNKYSRMLSLSDKLNKIMPDNKMEAEIDLLNGKIYILPSYQHFDFCNE